MNFINYILNAIYSRLPSPDLPPLEKKMAMPFFYNLVSVAGGIGAFVGVVLGAITIYGSNAAGYFVITGMLYILFSLAGYGVLLGFLAIVKAQIETRNMIADYIQGMDNLHQKEQRLTQ